MISYDAMVSEVTSRLGGRTDIAARIGRWVNYGFYELLLTPRFNFHELDRIALFNTSNGVGEYPLASMTPSLDNTNFWFALDLRDNTNQLHQEQSHYQVIDRFQQVPGRPSRYYRFKASIFLDPIPDGVYQMQMRYRERPPELTPGTLYENLGTEWEEIIVILSVIKGWEALDQRDKASEQRQLLEPILQMRQDVLALEDGADSETTIEAVYDEFRW